MHEQDWYRIKEKNLAKELELDKHIEQCEALFTAYDKFQAMLSPSHQKKTMPKNNCLKT